MQIPDERVVKVCQLGPVGALDLAERARRGEHTALCEWAMRAAYQKIVRAGVAPILAMRHVRTLATFVNFKPAIIP